MSADFSIEVDAKAVLRDFERIDRQSREKIINQSVGRAVSWMRTRASRETRQELNLTARDVNEVIKVRRQYRGPHSAAMLIEAKPVPLIKYKARPTKRGVTLKVLKRGGRKRIGYAFIKEMKSGHVGVFARDPKKSPRRGPKPHRSGLPITELHGMEVIDFLKDERRLDELKNRGGAKLVRELKRRIDYETGK